MDEAILVTLLSGFAAGFLTGWFLAWVVINWE
jgi:hypothetical protein